MKNLQELIFLLEKHKMFVEVSEEFLKNIKSRKKIYGWRSDGVGARLMCYANVLRLSKILKKDYVFFWDTNLQGYAVEKLSKEEFAQNSASSSKILKYLPNIKNIKCFDSSKQKISQPNIVEWKFLILKNESKAKVVKEFSKIIKLLFHNNKIDINKNVKNLEYGIHVRCGDIDALSTRLTNKDLSYKSDFNLGKWYPESMWQEILNKINKKTLLATNDYKYLKKNFKFKKNFLFMNSFHSKSQDYSYKFLHDIISISKSKTAICSIRSGSGLMISLMSKKMVTPEKFLNIENFYFEFYKILLLEHLKFNNFYSLLTHVIRYLFFKIKLKKKLYSIDFKNFFNKTIK